MNLSPHFTLEELIATQHRGIDNSPPPDVLANLGFTAKNLEAVRAYLGCPIIISSGYRCPELNKAVGGQPKSQHLTGQAVDFIAPGFGPPRAVAARLKDSGIGWDQLIVEFDRWVHISFAPTSQRGQMLCIDSSGVRPLFA